MERNFAEIIKLIVITLVAFILAKMVVCKLEEREKFDMRGRGEAQEWKRPFMIPAESNPDFGKEFRAAVDALSKRIKPSDPGRAALRNMRELKRVTREKDGKLKSDRAGWPKFEFKLRNII